MKYKALEAAGIVAGVAGVTAVDFRVLHVNSATAGFTFLVLILGLATRVGLRESIIASLVSVAAYNFFFLPPVGTFTIAEPQNWVALFAFLATAVTASKLSSNARERAEEARARQQELQRMYDFSRGLMLGNEGDTLGQQVVRQVVESFAVRNAWLYDRATGAVSKMYRSETAFPESALAEAAETGRMWRDETVRAVIVPVGLGGASFGSLALAGEAVPPEIALGAIAQLVAIAIERARMQEIAARIDAARQNEQLKSTLLDALAHEFKTPLTSVKAATTTLLSSALGRAEERELLTIVDEEADRMTRLVSDSIELARLGTAPVVLHAEVCSPGELLLSAVDGLRGLSDGREVRVELSPGLPMVFADRKLSELALKQILTNAVKYSPGKTEIRVTARQDKRFVAIGVSNVGMGIRRTDREKIFEKFYRAPEVRSRIPGTGMGLSIAREIIESQGGAVLVESEPGEGATFSMTLPIAGGDAPQPGGSGADR